MHGLSERFSLSAKPLLPLTSPSVEREDLFLIGIASGFISTPIQKGCANESAHPFFSST
ncbi:hypothetical protein CLOSTMETH_00845 [[Clostridium] methylpentosum DSM 5476]|uniref:Uncharacterized protein n=1 Tax=[Clostridium] methylpentosum DSM 5476 TaxID=537013 RepID=C0EAJ0_9FIRM|nr:hypothetical protein CLOSTMETH_00845 [[Clostridium] methylpentosum DSM 5476]